MKGSDIIELINTHDIKVDSPETLILTHGLFGRELIKSAEMDMGEFKSVPIIPLFPKVTRDNYMLEVLQVLETMPKGSFVLAELFWRMPSNINARISNEYKFHALSGLNLPMLIEAIDLIGQCTGIEPRDAVLISSKVGCKDIKHELRGGEKLFR